MESTFQLAGSDSPLQMAPMDQTYTPMSPDVLPVNQQLQDRLSPLNGAVGQLSFAPATKTTVVTTTTTTTTSFPPFFMKAPRHLKDRDPELYPLASSPTPHSIKRLKFDIGGVSAEFEEADNPDQSLDQYTRQQELLRKHKGSVQTVKHSSAVSSAASPEESNSYPTGSFVDAESQHCPRVSATPLSAPDVAELQSFHRRNKRPVKVPSLLKYQKYVGANVGSADANNAKANAISPEDSEDELDNVLPTRSKAPRVKSQQSNNPKKRKEKRTAETRQPIAGSATPPMTDADLNTPGVPPLGSENHRPTSFHSIDTSPIQDGSLPSPSLSPITAAANMHRSTAASRFHETPLLASNVTSQKSSSQELNQTSQGSDIHDGDVGFNDESNSLARPPSLPDVPVLLDTFDAMPDSLQSYVMYQLLRRCSKSTIRLVSESVDPALRCDYLRRLPLELSLQILQYLDFKSLCRAAQVSKKWRRIIDSDERRWLDMISEDGYDIPPGEIQKAISEGWGWKIVSPNGREYPEYDHSISTGTIDGDETAVGTSDGSRCAVSLGGTNHFSSISVKRKRKPGTKYSSQKKQKRRQQHEGLDESRACMKTVELAQGPLAYAKAAAIAIPNPRIGIKSLRNLHLFKSIYQRQHMIRQSWMQPDTEPLHLAFRAHQRHVVTCLQFDSDKILTGSDDANIDIYDTKNGASLKRLEGHEGGVWALEYQDNILVSGSTDRSVRVWNMETGKCLQVFQGHTSTVRCLQILQPTKIGENADGSAIIMPRQPLIITGSRDSTCRVWRLPKIGDRSVVQAGPPANDSDNPYFVRALTGHHHSVRAIAAHGDTLVSGSYDSTVRVWKISTGEMVHRLTGHTTKVYSVVLDYARGRCISGSMDNLVKVWSLETGQCLFNLEGHSSLVGLLDLKDDCLVSAAADATLRIWDPENGRCRHVLGAHTGAITCFAHDGQKVISGSERTLKMWNTQTGEFVRDLLTDLSGVWQIKFDYRRCVAAVQRNNWTYIEVLDFGAPPCPHSRGGKRIVVDNNGHEVAEDEESLELEEEAEGDIVDLGDA